MNRLLIFFLFFSFSNAYAQFAFNGEILDTVTKKSIPYVNVGIPDRGMGTVSDEEGIFVLNFNIEDYDQEEFMQFSCIGYKTLKIPLKNLKDTSNEFPKLFMEPLVEKLNEVVVFGSKKNIYIDKSVGYSGAGSNTFGYWKDDISLGGELATLIQVRKGKRKLKRLSFSVLENASDSVLVRVNIYDVKKGYPGDKLVSENIIKIIEKKPRPINIFLEPNNIVVENDFIVSLELLHVYGDTIGLALLASNQIGTSYKRMASQDSWETLENAAMAFHLKTSFSRPNNRRFKRIKDSQISRTVSGITFSKGSAVSNVLVQNSTTGQTVLSNKEGTFVIAAETNDILKFTHESYRQINVRVSDKPKINVALSLR